MPPSCGTILLVMARGRWIVLAAAGSLFGCIGGQSSPSSPLLAGQQGSQQELPILWETHGTYSRVARRLRIVARDEATLAQLPLADVPVDFRRQMVLIATLGPVRSAGYGIRITRVWRDGNVIRATVRVLRPPASSEPRPLVLASPYHIVVVPKSDLNVLGFSTDVPSDAIGLDWTKFRR